MSGRPNPEGAANVIRLLKTQRSLRKEIEELRYKVDRFKEACGLLADVDKALKEELRKMDLDRPGNHGWEHRLGWFLEEMFEQQEKERGQ